ncbi:MAG TPA: ASCH domain-containing protein [Archaeoglobus profundus]|nr:ASCH domain-containing protein [Archaeoglobus profundus]
MIKLGLIVKEPYASLIIRGEKIWEVRKRRTNVRGEIFIISNGKILGKVKLIDVLGPFTVDELAKYFDKHRVSYEKLKEYSRGSKLYAWVLVEAKKFDKPIKVKIPRGAQVWVKLMEVKE